MDTMTGVPDAAKGGGAVDGEGKISMSLEVVSHRGAGERVAPVG